VSERAEKPGSGWLEFLFEIQYSLNTQFHSGIKMTPYEAVYGQQANDGILVGTKIHDHYHAAEYLANLLLKIHVSLISSQQLPVRIFTAIHDT
jgi:hypothetical protein